MRCVVDTNVFVSAVILPGSIPRQAVSRVLNREILLACEPTMNELKEVLFRPKLDHYVSGKLRAHFISQLESVAEFVPIIQVIRERRHPKDDKFLELALNGRGNVIFRSGLRNSAAADIHNALEDWRQLFQFALFSEQYRLELQSGVPETAG